LQITLFLQLARFFFAPQTSSYYESLKLTVQEVGWKRNKEKES
jgi:hypothetical protein